MKLAQAVEIIRRGPQPSGYRVHLEHLEGRFLRSDYFPDGNEPPLPTEESAWTLAEQFAAQTYGRCVNLYVVNADDWTPVPGYEGRKIVNRLETSR